METILVHPCYGTPIIQYAAIAQAKQLVFEVCDNFQKQTYRSRLKMATSTGVLMLSIPIQHRGAEQGRQSSAEVYIENKFHWQRDHWRGFKAAYQTSPYFEYYEDAIEPLYTQTWKKLMDFNLAIHDFIMDALQLEVHTTQTTSWQREPPFTDLRHLVVAKKEPAYALPPYHQLFHENHGYIPNLTVLDILFNEGPNALTYLENIELSF